MRQAQAQTGAAAETWQASTIPEKPGFERVQGRRGNWYYRRVTTSRGLPADSSEQRGDAAPEEGR